MHNFEGLDRVGGFSFSQLFSPFGVHAFRVLWAGMAVSLLGDGVFMVALAWQTYELSNVPTALSLVMLSSTVPQLALLLFGGVISDRLPRAKVILVSDAVRGVVIGVAAWLSISDQLTLTSLALLTAVYGAATAFFAPAFDAVIPDIVPPELLSRANSVEQLVQPLALRMLGPALGGWLIGSFGVGWALGFNALTFGVSAIVVLFLRVPAAAAPERGSMLGDLRSGLAYVRHNVWLWGTFAAAAFAYLAFMGPAEVLLPYLVKEEMGGTAFELSMVFTVGGIGAVLSAIVVGSRQMPRADMTFIYVAWTLSTLMVAGYGVARLPWQLMAASFAFSALETAGTIVWVTTKQQLIPTHLLGRVSSLDWFLSIGLLPVSLALTGHASAAFGARGVLIGGGVIGAGITLAALFLPGMRDAQGQKVHADVRADDRIKRRPATLVSVDLRA